MGTSLDEWRQQLDAITAAEGDKLVRFAREFLASEHAERAIELGWTEMELFGLYRGDLALAGRRADTQGLVASLTIGATHSYAIVTIEEERAVLRTDGGATLMHRRRLGASELAVLFWEHPALRGRAH